METTLSSVGQRFNDLIISDGGSTDDTLKLAISDGARIAAGCPGRGWQLARAANFTSADWLLFLHSDTCLDAGFEDVIQSHIAQHPNQAGYFKLRFDAKGWKPRVMEGLVALRCRLFGLPYGDQGLLISQRLYNAVGGYEKIILFEDVAIVRALGKRRLRALSCDAITDADKYEADGYFKRGFANFRLLRRYLSGESIATLQQAYNRSRP